MLNQNKNLMTLFKEWNSLVDPKIKEILTLYVDKKNHKLVNYQASISGKKIRPAITIAGCLICKGKIEDALYPAAGLEILHNCSLIYDDIIDNSEMRRGKPTTWVKFGKSVTECIGINYSVSIFQAANRSKQPFKISEIFAKTMKILVDGEILDILFEQSGREDEKYVAKNRYRKITEKDYLKMVGKKTASLIEACLEVGALTANASKKEIEGLKKYGFNLGIAFQIQDDILDIFGEKKKLGKKIGKDIEERKLGNIVIFYALKELKNKDKNKLLEILRKKTIKDKDIKEAVSLIKNTKAKEGAERLGKKYVKKAKEGLVIFPQGEYKDLLNNIADFSIKREK